MDYTIQPKQVVYNTLTKEKVRYFSGKAGEVTFDSIAEFKCYLILASLGLPIKVHEFNEALAWKVDFSINFLTERSKQLPLLTETHYELNRHGSLLVEYKGVIDVKTTERVSKIPEILLKSLVIVTNKAQSIVYYDKLSNNIVNLKTMTLRRLKELCNAS